MRSDMYKLITECYRSKGPWKNTFRKQRKKIKRMPIEKLEELSDKQSIRANKELGRGFSFGENLSPIFRYLDSRVGDPWNDIYSDVRKNIPSGTLGDHVLTHVKFHVLEHDLIFDGNKVYIHKWKKKSQLSNNQLYIDDSGILREYRRVYSEREKLGIVYDFRGLGSNNEFDHFKLEDGKWMIAVFYKNKKEIPKEIRDELGDVDYFVLRSVPKDYRSKRTMSFSFFKEWRILTNKEVESMKIYSRFEEFKRFCITRVTKVKTEMTEEEFRNIIHKANIEKKCKFKIPEWS